MPTITLEVQDRGKAIALLEAALHRQAAYYGHKPAVIPLT